MCVAIEIKGILIEIHDFRETKDPLIHRIPKDIFSSNCCNLKNLQVLFLIELRVSFCLRKLSHLH
jgi:hypothetical protein